MKRWKVTYSDNTTLLLYSDQKDKFFHKLNKKLPNVIDVHLCTDISYLTNIEEIKAKSKFLYEEKIKRKEINEYYECRYNKGTLVIKLSKDIRDNTYYDLAMYQEHKHTDFMYSKLYTLSTPKKSIRAN